MNPNNLMVQADPWHWRKATYWDMPKCATCDSKNEQGDCENPYSIASFPPDAFGCVYHSQIVFPTGQADVE